VGAFLLWALVFGIAFSQWPLYSENQNTKFLHGLASSGFGYLNEDWLANTLDPLPAFSLLVAATYRLLPEATFHLYHALLLGTYLFSLAGIAAIVFPLNNTRAGRLVFLVIIIALHASLVPPFSLPVLGTSLGWLLQAGVANQYLFNPVFQPSTFGVLLILSIYLFLRNRPYWASAVAALAAVLHSTYLPSAAALTGSYMVLVLVEGRQADESWSVAVKPALTIGLLALAVVTPVLIYNAIVFAPTSPEAWRRSQDIIVNFRIPHHSLPEIWIDNTVYVKMVVVLLALFLVRKSKLFTVMLISFLAAVLLTMLQVITGSDTLAFIAPWRISAFLVPLSSAMIVAFVVATLFQRFPDRAARLEGVILAACAIALAILVLRGGVAVQDTFQARRSSDSKPMMDFVQETRAPGETYLTPASMAEFRLATGAPVLVTFKSHPYKDVEVIQWQERVLAANDFYGEPSCAKLLSLATSYGITHVVLEGGQLGEGCPPETREVYRDERYRVLQIDQNPSE
jgi:hypothetical protein